MKSNKNEPHHGKTNNLHMQKQRRRSVVTAKLVSAFVFTTQIVHFLFCLNSKIQTSSSFLCLYRPVFVGPVRKPHCWFSHDAAQIKTTVYVLRPSQFFFQPCRTKSEYKPVHNSRVIMCLAQEGIQPAWDLSIRSPMLYHRYPYLTNKSDIIRAASCENLFLPMRKQRHRSAVQLLTNQRLCFLYTDSTIPFT